MTPPKRDWAVMIEHHDGWREVIDRLTGLEAGQLVRTWRRHYVSMQAGKASALRKLQASLNRAKAG